MRFYRRSLRAAVELEGGTFDGVHHVDDWVPPRLVTATGPIGPGPMAGRFEVTVRATSSGPTIPSDGD